MSLTITIDNQRNQSNGDLNEWLNGLRQQLITANTIVIQSSNPAITGRVLSQFFRALPALPVCIELYCQYNQLAALPALPFCIILDCSYNQLDALPALPLCTDLICRYNQLVALPALPVCTYLSCENNQLAALPELPVCRELDCSNNQLAALPALPVCEELSCSGNPNLFYEEEFAHRFGLPFPSPAYRKRPKNARKIVGGYVPLKYMIKYTSNKNIHYPFLSN